MALVLQDRRHRRLILLGGADAVDLLDRQNEDLAVSDRARARRTQDRVDCGLHEVVRDADLEAHLLRELHLYGRSPVRFHALSLSAVPFHTMERQTADLGAEERLEDVVQLLRTNDRDDE